MTAIIDYGVGNLFSLACSFSSIGEEALVTDDLKMLEMADRLVLPGVGAFRDARKALRESGLEDGILSLVKKGKPILGICLGVLSSPEKNGYCAARGGHQKVRGGGCLHRPRG